MARERAARLRAPPFIDPPEYARHRPEETLLYELVERLNRTRRLKRVFGIEIDGCARCGGQLKVIASIEERELIERLGSAMSMRCPVCREVMVKPIRRPDQTEALTQSSLRATGAGAKGGLNLPIRNYLSASHLADLSSSKPGSFAAARSNVTVFSPPRAITLRPTSASLKSALDARQSRSAFHTISESSTTSCFDASSPSMTDPIRSRSAS